MKLVFEHCIAGRGGRDSVVGTSTDIVGYCLFLSVWFVCVWRGGGGVW